MDGIICIYKEKGITSFDVVAAVRRIYGTKRVGHGGTLDPMAEGVLPIFIGKATKAADFCPDDTKQYLASFRFGLTTDTQDITGQVLTSNGGYVSRNKIPMIERVFSGELMQTPPMYSAVKVNGMKLYDLARKGETVDRQPRRIYIYRLQVQKYENNEGEMLVTCSKGTYIRTLIHDIGEYLGVGGVMTGLVRTRSGVFTVNNCHRLNELESKTTEELEQLLLPLEKLYDKMPKAYLDDEQTRLFRNGAVLDADRIHFDKIQDKGYYIESSDGIFLGLGRISADHQLEVIRRFNTDSAEYSRLQAIKQAEEAERQKALQLQKEEEEKRLLELQREQEEEERRRAEAAEAKADLERRKRESAERRAAAEQKQREALIGREKAVDIEDVFSDEAESEEDMAEVPEDEILTGGFEAENGGKSDEFQSILPPEFQQMTEAVNGFHKEIGDFLKNAAAASRKTARKTAQAEDIADSENMAKNTEEDITQERNTDVNKTEADIKSPLHESEEDMRISPDNSTNQTEESRQLDVDFTEEYDEFEQRNASTVNVAAVFEQAQNELKNFEDAENVQSEAEEAEEEDEKDLSYLDQVFFEEPEKTGEAMESALDLANEELLNMLGDEQ